MEVSNALADARRKIRAWTDPHQVFDVICLDQVLREPFLRPEGERPGDDLLRRFISTFQASQPEDTRPPNRQRGPFELEHHGVYPNREVRAAFDLFEQTL
jgi:hypothetical protein